MVLEQDYISIHRPEFKEVEVKGLMLQSVIKDLIDEPESFYSSVHCIGILRLNLPGGCLEFLEQSFLLLMEVGNFEHLVHFGDYL